MSRRSTRHVLESASVNSSDCTRAGSALLSPSSSVPPDSDCCLVSGTLPPAEADDEADNFENDAAIEGGVCCGGCD